ncbi:MAG TPA: PIG-L family deacetylase [Fermentimonas sp.]|nr:PIG-L family deacetylase [Fermentimonas sp.]
MSKVLFVSVHPDDETLGCGGTILKHKSRGDKIYWLNLTGPSIDHPYGFSREMIERRDYQIKKVSQEYKFDSSVDLSQPTQMLDSIEARILIKDIVDVLKLLNPNIIYIPNRSDVHSDHRVAFQAIYSCTKNFRAPYIKKILMYETLSETEFAAPLPENAFMPNYFVDITEFMDKKIEIMKIYDTELMPDPYPRSIHAIKGLAAFRGSRNGVQYAEAFMSLFEKG